MDKSPFLPAESDIEHVVKRIVEEAHEVGRAPGDVKLEECVERLQFGYEAIITDDIATLKTICRHLRSYQKKSLGKEELGRPFPGDISSEDLQCLEDRNWLNDKIINRYMDMIAEEYPTIAVAVSSFFIETLNKKPENLPDFRNKVALIPCCLNSHWSVVAALERQKSLVIFSSMSNQIEDDDLATFLRLRTHFCATYDGRWDLRIHTSLKSQTNSDDCGVFGTIFFNFCCLKLFVSVVIRKEFCRRWRAAHSGRTKPHEKDSKAHYPRTHGRKSRGLEGSFPKEA